jgi:O-antigen/teichoic acid export membrane protein
VALVDRPSGAVRGAGGLAAGSVSAARGGALLSLAFIAVGLGNYAFTLGLARLLAPDAFGVAMLVQSFLLSASWFAASCFPWSTARRLSGLADRREQASFLRGALAGNLVLATTLAALLLVALAAGWLKLGSQPGAPVVLGAAACSMLGLSAASKGGLQGILRLSSVAAANILEVVTKLAVGLALSAAGFGAVGAVAGILAGTVAATMFTLAALGRNQLLRTRGWPSWQFYAETLPVFAAMGGLAVLTSLDVFAIKVLSPASTSNTTVALYQVAVTLARIPYFFGSAVTTAVFPHIARHRTEPALRTLYLRKALLYLLTFLTPVGLTFLLVPESALLFFFPVTYLPAAPALRVLSMGGVALSVASVLTGSLQAAGLLKAAALAAAGAVASEVLLLGVVIPLSLARGQGTLLVATAAVFDTVMVLLVVLLLVVATRRFFEWRLRPRAALGLAVAALAFSTVLSLIPHQGRGQLIGAVSLALAVYALFVVALGVLSKGDLATLLSGVTPSRKVAPRA